jgi:spore maturation protein CgeB
VARTKILCAGILDPGSTARHRMDALARLGYDVLPFNFGPYLKGTGRLANWFYHRALTGPVVDRINRDIRKAAEVSAPAFILIDKGIFVRAESVAYLSEVGVTIQHNLDNPFGYMGEKSWRLLVEAIPYYDVHFVPREVNLADYRKAGARHVMRVPLAFEPTIHYPPPPTWREGDRRIDVSFTGAPYDDRTKFITKLLTDYGIAVDVRGNRWERALEPKIVGRIYSGPSVYGDGYRQRFWDSKLCLSFITHSNCDQVAHKSFEIAAAGGVLLAEASAEHKSVFKEGKEALFFTDIADCARLIREYLPRSDLRAEIAQAAHRRSIESGYSNDDRLKQALDEVRSLFGI